MRQKTMLLGILGFFLACSPAKQPDDDASASASPSGSSSAPATSASSEPSSSASASSSGQPSTSPPAAADELSRATRFAVKAYRAAAAAEPGKSLMLSPVSLRLALGMVYVGSTGETKKEMATALELDADTDNVVKAATDEMTAWKNTNKKGVAVGVANRLWGDKSTTFDANFLSRNKAGWGAGLEQVDFKGAAESARTKINGWVKTETKDRIPELMPKGSLTGDTRLVVTNAVVFDGQWTKPFDEKATAKLPFFVGGKTPVEVPTMKQHLKAPYADVGDAQLVQLFYGDGDAAMLIVLPKTNDGLAKLESQLTAETLASWSKAVRETSFSTLDLTLPKFELAWGGSVTPLLGKLGMKRAFANDAEFGGIASGQLSISDVVHKTFIKVYEKGTEAAAATGVAVTVTSVEMPKTVTIDHPFLYVIREVKTERVLFIGRVTDPRSP
ncbi:MAG: serpin family protein [Polyangiaceae bacterium]